jgi:phage N-6-adenine-methyltransferase
MVMPKQKPHRSTQTYGTPPDFLEAVKNRLKIKEFRWDLAATEENKVAACHFGPGSPFGEDSLATNWPQLGWCWLNPPFSNLGEWVEKAATEARKGAQIAMLVPASVGSNWWQDWVEPWAYTAFLNGRLTFVGCKDPYPKDCALLLYHPWGFNGGEIWDWRN